MTENEVERARSKVIKAMGKACEVYGINKKYGEIYGILYFSDTILSIDKITEKSEYTEKKVENTLNKLEKIRCIKKLNGHYKAETDWWEIIDRLIENEGRKEINIMLKELQEAEKLLESSEKGKTELEKIHKLERTYNKLNHLLNLYLTLPRKNIKKIINNIYLLVKRE